MEQQSQTHIHACPNRSLPLFKWSKTVLIHSLDFSSCFILKHIIETLDLRQEYTMDRKPGYLRIPLAHTFTPIYTPRGNLL